MISTSQLDELRKLHKDHIANTFLFTSKILEQHKRITDAQADALHAWIREASTSLASASNDPASFTQDAVDRITKAVASHNSRATNVMAEAAAAYAEIMRLVVEYGNDSFAGFQNAGRALGAGGTSPAGDFQNAWSAPFMGAFESAAKLMSTTLQSLGNLPGDGSGRRSSNDDKHATDAGRGAKRT